MDVTRRGFLRMLGAALPAAVVAPKYFFAPVGGWKSDVILNPNQPLTRIDYFIRLDSRCTYAGDELDVYRPEGGTSVGTVVVDKVDPLTNTIYFMSQKFVRVGDYLVPRNGPEFIGLARA